MSHPPVVTRRELLVRGLGLVGVGAALPTFVLRTALAGPPAASTEKILVILQLSGGHDGLSAVVPYADDNYARARRTTRIAADEVIRLDDCLGLHPALAGLHDLFDQGHMAIVQGVGYPNPNRSHFYSMDIWHSAEVSRAAPRDGWLGRYADEAFPDVLDPTLTVAVGPDQAPLALRGRNHAPLCLRRPGELRWTADRRLAKSYRNLTELTADASSSNRDFVARTALDTDEAAEAIQRLAGRGTGAIYPASPLAASLQIAGNLIAGGLSTRVYYVVQRGFDTHAGQRQRHDRLMAELNDAVTAFQRDLVRQGNAERVLTLAFSEFGRRVRENGSQGTDHGAAGPVFLFGPAVQPGLHGQHPSLAESELDRGDLVHGIDFRGVYASVLERWLGAPSRAILGATFPAVDCIRG